MRRRYAARGGAAVLATAGAVFALSACGASVRAVAVTGPRCGAQTADVLAREAGYAAHQIYANEVHGAKVAEDRRQVQGYAPLVAAARSGGGTGLQAAVTSLVYSHTHIVRLSVTTATGSHADVGGPYIIAPVTGTISARGRAVAHYVFSVQDDLGYVKLVTRFVGVPVVLRRDRETIPVRGVPAQAPAAIPALGAVTFHGARFAAYSFQARSFPDGRLRVSLLVPLPAALENETCPQVKAREALTIAQHTVRRYRLGPHSFYPYSAAAHRFTGARIYVHVAGRRVTGSSGHGPAHLPVSGTTAIGGINFRVESFTAPSTAGTARVFLLVAE